ncbi:hypothetical protein BDC45DRAFT_529088 [Circinella umbellata]|nr:hypothetical protein BDC45DRAFT_529088 [Circinella umbellata]
MNKYKHDPTITMCYKVAKDVFAKEIQEQESAVDAFERVARQTKNQFKRIRDEVEANGPDMRKKIKELANNGILYADGCLHLSEQQQTEGSMSPPPQILAHLENRSCSPALDILAPPLCDSMSDLEYVKNWKNKYLVNNKRMNWKKCFDDGKKHGKFKSYKNPKNLKNTYNEKYSSSPS